MAQPDGGREAVLRVATARLPTRYGIFTMIGYRGPFDGEHVALIKDQPSPSPSAPPLVRVHSECLTGDALRSDRCDCGEQLEASLGLIGDSDCGALIYVRGHEGRGIGLLNKVRAYALQDQGLDTVDANTRLGLPVDARQYDQSAEILRDLGMTTIRLLSSNPRKQAALERHGIAVTSRISLDIADRADSSAYLSTKRARMNHDPSPSSTAWELLRRGLAPDHDHVGPQHELTERYGPLVGAGDSLVIAQLGQSMDGFIASRTGDARFVTGPADREHLHRLRALVDAVVVGAQTVATDDCRLTVRAVSGSNPVRVVLDPTARTPLGSHLLTDGAAPTLWVVGRGAQLPEQLADHVDVHRMDSDGDFSPRCLLQVLAQRGLGRVLVEGGGRTVSAFLRAGTLDRLYLTTAPMLIGDGVPGIRFDGSDALTDALSAPTRRITLGDDVCTEFDFSAVRHPS